MSGLLKIMRHSKVPVVAVSFIESMALEIHYSRCIHVSDINSLITFKQTFPRIHVRECTTVVLFTHTVFQYNIKYYKNSRIQVVFLFRVPSSTGYLYMVICYTVQFYYLSGMSDEIYRPFNTCIMSYSLTLEILYLWTEFVPLYLGKRPSSCRPTPTVLHNFN